MQLKAFKLRRYTFFFLLFGLLFITNSAHAQENSAFNAGIAIAITTTPEESELDKAGQTTEVFVDLSMVRFGLNSTAAKKNFSLYDQTWNTFITTDVYYAAWRPVLGDGQDSGTYAILGVGYFLSSMSFGNGVSTQSSQGFGLITGIGGNVKLGEIVFGTQLNYLRADARFHDIEIAVGSTQLLFTMHLEI